MDFSSENKLKILFSHYGRKDYDGFCRSFMLARGLASFGHDVTFLTSQASEFCLPYRKEKRDGVKIISFPDIVPQKLRSMGLGILNILLKSMCSASRKYDIVQSDSGHRPSSGIPCLINRMIFKSKYISEWWDFFGKGGIYDERPWWYRLTLGNYDTWSEIHNKMHADGVVALSEFTKKRAIDHGIKEDRILVLNGGADTESIKYFPDTGLKGKYGVKEDSLTFCFIGMSEGELGGLEPFLLAMNKLKKEIPISWISTGGKISDEKKDEFSIGDELTEMGWVSYNEFDKILSCSDVCILLQKDIDKNRARWPNKVGDYLAAGRLIMANPVGEMDKIMDENPTAFYTVNWNMDSIVNAIRDLALKKDNLQKIGKNIREIAETKYSWNCKAKELSNFYNHILRNEK